LAIVGKLFLPNKVEAARESLDDALLLRYDVLAFFGIYISPRSSN
jgi:hypothetical protein